MERSITVRVVSVYGKETVYPVSEGAKHFASLCGTKTLTPAALSHIKALGFSIKIEQNLVNWE